MCGIVGIINSENPSDSRSIIKQMVATLNHRGPDEFGIYFSVRACLGHTRLSIIDLSTGSQPIHNEDKTMWIIYNGEVFNYPELRKLLESKGHRFYTTSDTEVILHGYEEFGEQVLSHLNGQFAFAIWHKPSNELFLARDRLGIRPVFYALHKNELIFASEIKAILAHPNMSAEIDPFALSQIFTFWTTLYPRTAFKNIRELPPGHFLRFKNNNLKIQRYWQLSFPDIGDYDDQPLSFWSEQLRELLIDAAIIRLRADVPVGAYLSGGLDSSVITAIIHNYTQNRMNTFSISFAEKAFDESSYQHVMSKHLGTEHNDQPIANQTIADNFPRTIWHTEKPVLRTSPVPMMQLSELVRKHHFKVVLTGEGSDEILGGYNIFKETMVRRFWAKSPSSTARPMLLQKLYPYLAVSSKQVQLFTQRFFSHRLLETDHPTYSHFIRWRNYEKIIQFLSPEMKAMVENYDPVAEYVDTLPANFHAWHPFCKAQYIEIDLFMAGYLLSSQGDRMGMANSVEGRFPFLDHRLVEFCSRIPVKYKLRGLNEKFILKHTFNDLLPALIVRRSKQPYRAPISQCFYSENNNSYLNNLFVDDKNTWSLFSRHAVKHLLNKWKSTNGRLSSETDNMAFIAILSTALLQDIFVGKNMITSRNSVSAPYNIVIEDD